LNDATRLPLRFAMMESYRRLVFLALSPSGLSLKVGAKFSEAFDHREGHDLLESLRSKRNVVELEIMWLQQAIRSRKNVSILLGFKLHSHVKCS
jgi:hypothetical protein